MHPSVTVALEIDQHSSRSLDRYRRSVLVGAVSS